MDGGGGCIDDMMLALAYVVMALGLNIIVGFAGLLDLGYVAFFAIGAYTMGYFGSLFHFNVNGGEGLGIFVTGPAAELPGIHTNFLLVADRGGGRDDGRRHAHRTAHAAPARRLHRDRDARLRRDHRAHRDQRRRDQRLRDLADGRPPGHHAGRQDRACRSLDPFTSLNLSPWYWVAFAMVLIVLFVNFRLRDSRLGRAWIALREDEVAAASMGVPLVRTKLLAYGTGAAFGGISGAFLASYLNTVNADQFQFSFSIFILAMVILGGLGSIWGVVVGAVALSFINNRLIPDVLNDVPGKIGLDFDLTELSFGIFGFLLVIMMVLRPEGLIPERRRQIELEVGIEDLAGVRPGRPATYQAHLP